MIKTALISVSDKTGVVEFAQSLAEDFGVQILSTGGTKKKLEEAGIAVQAVDDYTGFPEMMDGRVKTLHPKIHGGLLALRANEQHMNSAKEHDISMIDLVCVNLYPFQETIAKEGVTEAEAIEQIDIGGPSMLRSAAKNFQSVTVVTDHNEYENILSEMKANNGATTPELRRRLALDVFWKTSQYDAAITSYLSGMNNYASFYEKVEDLRYGENPHHKGSFWNIMNMPKGESEISNATIHQGKSMSYLNYFDAAAALDMVREYDKPAVSMVKHANPCGIAEHESNKEAFIRAYECDPRSAFGVIIGMNREFDEEIMQVILDRKMFVEIIIAPTFSAGALEMLKAKPNIRAISVGEVKPLSMNFDIRKVGYGLLYQDWEPYTLTKDDLQFVTDVKPTEEQINDLLFAWKVVKVVKSNAIILAKDNTTVGIGAGQMSRVDSTEIATRKAGDKVKGSVLASDAFFPFPDSIEVAHEHGIAAIIQPGGSMKDEEVIAKANELSIPMVLTGKRAFLH